VSISPRLPAVLVANLGSPEIDRLSVALERRAVLARYVRPYLNKGRWWERSVERLAGIGTLYRQTLGRRKPPAGLPIDKVIEAGVSLDFANALVGRAPLIPARWRAQTAHALIFATERAVGRAAARRAHEVDIVVASYGTAREAFEAVRRKGGRAVLNYPIAHNGYQARFYAEEAALQPHYAAALPRMHELPREYSERLETECRLADCILVGSSFARDAFVAMGYDMRKIAVAPYGVDTELFAPAAVTREDGLFRVLFVGQIGQRKGVSYLFEAYRSFRRPDSELHVVGGYVPGSEVYREFAPLYRHTPNVPHRQLPSIFQEAKVLVFPTLMEGMPLVVLEAMACGVPVITTTHGPGDLVRDGIDGFVVPIRDSAAITARLEQLYRDRGLREQMGQSARQQAERFTWDAYAAKATRAVLMEAPA
jgi:glycosyltransferase involved in cell wall biosynthesis